jgi:hypothetical protein
MLPLRSKKKKKRTEAATALKKGLAFPASLPTARAITGSSAPRISTPALTKALPALKSLSMN